MAVTAAASRPQRITSFHRLIWLMPIAYALHIVEEFTTGFAQWVQNVVGGGMSVNDFLINNALFMALLVAFTAYAGIARTPTAAFLLIIWASANLFWDFLFHLATTAIFDRYSPGLITATLLYFPISIAVSLAVLNRRLLTPGAFATASAIGAALMLFVIWAGLYHFAH